MKLNLYENEKNHLLCLSDEKEISSVKSINGLKDYLKCRKSVARKKGKKALKLLYGETNRRQKRKATRLRRWPLLFIKRIRSIETLFSSFSLTSFIN